MSFTVSAFEVSLLAVGLIVSLNAALAAFAGGLRYTQAVSLACAIALIAILTLLAFRA